MQHDQIYMFLMNYGTDVPHHLKGHFFEKSKNENISAAFANKIAIQKELHFPQLFA